MTFDFFHVNGLSHQAEIIRIIVSVLSKDATLNPDRLIVEKAMPLSFWPRCQVRFKHLQCFIFVASLINSSVFTVAPVLSGIVANPANPAALLAPDISSVSGALSAVMPPAVSTPALLGGQGSSVGGQSPSEADK